MGYDQEFPEIAVLFIPALDNRAKYRRDTVFIMKGHGKAVIRAKLDAIKGIPRMLAKRSRCRVNEGEIRRFVLVWAGMRSPKRQRVRIK